MSKPTLEQCITFHKEEDPEMQQGPIIVPGLNTYAYGINRQSDDKGFIRPDRLSLDEIEANLFLPQLDADILQVELAEDIFENPEKPGIFNGLDFQGEFPGWLQERVDLIKRLAQKYDLKIQGTGTGQFLYTRMLALDKTGHLEFDVLQQTKATRAYRNLIRCADAVGGRTVGGHRVLTAFPERHMTTYSINQWAGHFGWKLPDKVDSSVNITEAEALNIQTAIALNRNDYGISSTTELMYQHDGMAPVGIDQMNRMHRIIQTNSPCQVYAHMDIGHVAVGADGPKQAGDYDLAAYAREVVWPAWIVHFNSLYDNAHGMPTSENVQRDLNVRDEKEGTNKSPHPELYCDVYQDWLIPTAERTRVMQLTPEPKDTKDVSKLVREAKETYGLIYGCFAETHTDVSGYLVPNTMVNQFKQTFGI